ncbi:MAG TPA: TraR/DksA family transcriptional regulator [Acidimicrobiia bacterium]|jgi:RNA polymerase-binding transcription factor DksA
MADTAIERTRAALTEKAAEVDAELGELLEQPDVTDTIQYGKRAGDANASAADRASRVAAAESLAALREEIDAALARLDAGDFGQCQQCGEQIAPARLDALPWTAYCVHCAAEHSAHRH